jgi:hypothetical protein
MLTLDANSFNAYIHNTLKYTDPEFIMDFIDEFCVNKRVKRQLKNIEKRFRKATKKVNTFPSKDANIVGIYMNLYALYRSANKEALHKVDMEYYDYLLVEVENNRRTEDDYRRAGKAIMTTNQLTNYFDAIPQGKDLECRFVDGNLVIDNI